MKTPSRSLRAALPVATVLSLATLASGCSHDKQTPLATPGVTAMQSPPEPNATPISAPPSTPNTPSAAGVRISAEILRACNIPDTDAYFPFDSSNLTAFDRTPLDQLASCFTTGPMAGHHLRLVGHADPRGADEYNVTLGQSRADAVARYLQDRGLGSNRTTTSSRGALDATGHDETGWAHDRRVDVLPGD